MEIVFVADVNVKNHIMVKIAKISVASTSKRTYVKKMG